MANYKEAFPSKYIRAADLKGKSVPVEIERVDREAIQGAAGRKLVVYFVNRDKGLVLNKTNASMIAKIANSDDTDEWVGTNIVIYPKEVEFQGELVDAVRVAAPAKVAPKAASFEDNPDDVDDSDIPF